MPYINFFGSSSVLGHAARHKKLVLAPNKGIINHLVQQYGLGVTCEPSSPLSIYQSMEVLIQKETALKLKAQFEDFLAGRTPIIFAKTLLELESEVSR